MAQSLEEKLRSRLSSAVKQVAEEMSSQAVSGYLVKRLVVEGSFRNAFAADGTVEGFQVKIKNKIGVATVVGCTPLKIDGEKFGVELVTITKDKNEYKAADISESLPMSVGFGDEFIIKVADEQGLEAGKHTIELGLKMVGLGIMNVKYDDTLAGEGRPRIRKTEPEQEAGGEAGDFADVMRRTVEIAAENVGRQALADCYKTVHGIVLNMTDTGEKFSVTITEDGEAGFVAGAVSGDAILTIITTRAAFHNMAHNKLNPGIAYAKGDIKLEGIPVLKLRGMDGIMTAIFRGYRAASEGISFEAASEGSQGGVLEEMLGMGLAAFDELLKALDKLLGGVGVKYFYEKSLNRVEWIWDILDREMRSRFEFGRGESPVAKSEVAEKKTAPTAPAEKPAPKAPAKSLQDRLRERITSVIETTVAEVARTSVSGYLVKRLIVPGSFKNFKVGEETAGFEVKLKNKLGVATVIGFSAIKIDGEEYGLELIEITKNRDVIPAAEISEKRPLSVSFGDEMLIRVKRQGGIAQGKHRVSLGVDMVGLGGVDVDYEETMA